MTGQGLPMPTGAPRAAFVEGILDGRVADAVRLQQAILALNGAGAGGFRSDLQGGRFSLFPATTQIVGGAFDEAAQARFLEALHGLLPAAVPGSIETNLRCRLVYDAVVAETLFVLRGDRIEPLTRVRPRTAADHAGVPPTTAVASLGLGRRELLLAAPLLLIAGGLVAWQSGWIDRVLAARAETLAHDTGPFTSMLALDADRSWGNYVVHVRRGPDYPATAAALAQWRDRTDDLVAHAAATAVGDGGAVFVQLLDADRVVLAENRIELRPLLTASDAVLDVKLPGRMRAAAVRLSLSKAPERK